MADSSPLVYVILHSKSKNNKIMNSNYSSRETSYGRKRKSIVCVCASVYEEKRSSRPVYHSYAVNIGQNSSKPTAADYYAEYYRKMWEMEAVR